MGSVASAASPMATCTHASSRTVSAGVDASAHPQAAEGDSEDERREHELEGVRRAAEHERQHPDPADLVHEGGHAREAGDDEEQAQLWNRCGRSRRGGWRGSHGVAAARQQHRGHGDREVEHAAARQRARKADRRE